jgi:C_GCAxxG_C_C family probable redox protein
MNPSNQNLSGVPLLIGERARNLFLSRRLHCSEAVLVTLNQGLGGGLEECQAIALAAPFSEGVGKSGCMCGGLGGGLLAIGLFLGGKDPAGQRGSIQRAAGDFMEKFRNRFGSSCCRVLSKRGSDKARSCFAHCSELTAQAGAMAAEIILAHHPELVNAVDFRFLEERDTAIGGWLKRALRRSG